MKLVRFDCFNYDDEKSDACGREATHFYVDFSPTLPLRVDENCQIPPLEDDDCLVRFLPVCKKHASEDLARGALLLEKKFLEAAGSREIVSEIKRRLVHA